MTEALHKVEIYFKKEKKSAEFTDPILTGLVARSTEGNTFVEKDTL